MPGLTDPRFSQSVTYVCEHNEGGAMGIMINQPAKLSYKELFEQLQLNDDYNDESPLLLGGPVQKDILDDIANHQGPKNVLIALGYAGWDAGQLEEEIVQNSWLTVPAEKHIIFDTPLDKRWTSAAKQLGIDLALMSSQAGHA